MTGILKTKSGHKYIVRTNGINDHPIFGWDIYSDCAGDRIITNNWDKLPGGNIDIFDIDNPPATVGYIPILGI